MGGCCELGVTGKTLVSDYKKDVGRLGVLLRALQRDHLRSALRLDARYHS